MKVGIAGAGGIGSNVAVNLVRSGVTNIKIVDFDTIEQSNLNRQFYFSDQIGHFKVEALQENLSRINPDVTVEAEPVRIDASNIGTIFNDCDRLVEGFDKQSEKKLFLEQLGPSKKIIVSANGIAGPDTASIITKQIGNIFVVGDFITDCQDARLYSHKVVTVAAIMSEIILIKAIEK